MDTREALLKAVIAAPDDDLPRLVYADWLEENGQQVAADYIRIACAGDAVTTIEYALRHWREVDDFRDVVKYGMGYDYSRGFVSGVHCSLANWLKHGPAVVREHPVQTVRLVNIIVTQMQTGWNWIPIDPTRYVDRLGDLAWGMAGFTTSEEAEKDCSDRIIQWAESQPA